MPRPISTMAPRAHYTLAVDESGSHFTPGGDGRLVGVLGQGGGLAGFHAVDANQATRQRALDELLRNKKLGVLGLDASQLPALPGDQWLGGVLHLVTWALLMLPEPTATLEVVVEERGGVKPGDRWNGAVQIIRERLTRVAPERAGSPLTLQAVDKTGHSLLGAADLLSHTWNDGAGAARGLPESGLLGTCLFGGPEHDLSRCLELALRPRVSGADWRWLVAQPGSDVPGTPAQVALAALGDRADRAQWTACVRAAADHLDSGQVDLHRARLEADWLDRHRPDDGVLPRPVELALAIHHLATENHRGEILATDRVAALAADHRDEGPALACLADLHLAVQHTNRFEFAAAREQLAWWAGQPVGVAGLRMHARVESSLGQHAAFLGQLPEAMDHLEQALALQERLSDPDVRAREQDQTRAYLAIVSTDHAEISDKLALERVVAVTGRLRQALLDPNTSPYHHHLILRWMAHRGGGWGVWQAYRKTRDRWPRGEHHPWPMIEAYRALLLRPTHREAALVHLQRGWDAALHEAMGPVLWLQGAAMLAIASHWGVTWDNLDEQLESIEEELPAAADRVAHLRRALAEPMEPREILRGALPFNFR